MNVIAYKYLNIIFGDFLSLDFDGLKLFWNSTQCN